MHTPATFARHTTVVAMALALALPLSARGTGPGSTAQPPFPPADLLIVATGDSLTHGTLDATNNWINTLNTYLHRLALSLSTVADIVLQQPLFSLQGVRVQPLRVPSNLAVDGADSFSIEGVDYYKRIGAPRSVINPGFLSRAIDPQNLSGQYEKVIYPLNIPRRAPTTQVGGANWLVNWGAPLSGIPKVLHVFWAGNNDSSVAALGAGGANPQVQPIPFEQIADEIDPLLALALTIGEQLGVVSFEPYSLANVLRNMTDVPDFAQQIHRVFDRFETETAGSPSQVDRLILTLPYYSSVGYLFDSEDLEFYLRKLDPLYSVPPSFARVAPPGEPITDFNQGDRISLLTFGFMYGLLWSGHSVAEVNAVLDVGGFQRDGLVMSAAESELIRDRIDQFNLVLAQEAAARAGFHLVDIGQFLNDALTGQTHIEVSGRRLTRKWIRGNGFSFDGVHPGYTGHSVIANFVIDRVNEITGSVAPTFNLDAVLAADPYIDRDGDGWAPGPNYPGQGITEILFFLKDPNDTDPGVGPELPTDFWERISAVLLEQLLPNAAIQQEAERRGVELPTTLR